MNRKGKTQSKTGQWRGMWKMRPVRPGFLLLLLAASLTAATTHAAPASAGSAVTQLTLDLSDGSRVIGTPAIDRMKMATDYATFEIPLSMLSTLELTGTGGQAQANLQNGDVLHTQLDAKDITMETVFGQVVIPLAQVRGIAVHGIGGTMPDGLVLYYSFDTNDGDRVVDMSRSGNDGQVRGATYTSEGKVGGAMSFSGVNQKIIVGNPANLQLQDFTIMAWIKRGSADKATGTNDVTSADLIGYGHAGYILAINDDGRLLLAKTDISEVGSDCDINDEDFHHIAVTKEGSQVIFYLDGVAYPAGAYDPRFEFDNVFAVGGRLDDRSHGFFGVIDQVAVFNRALSTDEVKGVYHSQK